MVERRAISAVNFDYFVQDFEKYLLFYFYGTQT